MIGAKIIEKQISLVLGAKVSECTGGYTIEITTVFLP
jgi:hypothetical protein